MKVWKRMSVIITLMMIAVTGNAATYQYTGTVELCPDTSPACVAFLINVGDTVGGSLTVDDSVAQPDSSFGYTEVTEFAFTVGLLNISSDTSSIVEGGVVTNSTGELIDGFFNFFVPEGASGFSNPPSLFTLDVTTATWTAYEVEPDGSLPTFTASGFGEFTLVPIPGALGMLLPALALLVGVRRKVI